MVYSVAGVAEMKEVPEMPSGIKARPALADETEVRFVRVSQFSKITNMSQPSVFRSIQAGELKAYRRGRSLFIPVEEIDRFIAAEAA
jgi:excisionase family DNA binding protein